MDSPFFVGPIATGKGFIGREHKLEEYRRKLLDGKRGSLSICGIPRIGKSSLVYKLLHESGDLAKKNIIVADVGNLGKFSSFFALWREIVELIHRSLKAASLCDTDLESMINAVKLAGDDYENISYAIDTLFETLKEYELKTIIYIDEFDYVSKVFKNSDDIEAYQYFQFLRSLITDPKYIVTFIIVSRRSMEYLEDRCCGGSVFHLAFDKQQLIGFGEDELLKVRKTLEEFQVVLSDSEWSNIIYRAGCSPYLLSIASNELIVNKDLLPVDDIIASCTQRYYDYYKEIIELLDTEGYMKRIIQIFVGPKYDILPQHVRELENRGYITLYKGKHETISELFAQYMTDLVRMDESLNMWPLLTEAEKRLRLIIETKLTEKYGQTWETIIRSEYEARCQANPNKNEFFVDFSKADKYIRSTRNKYNPTSTVTVLSVIGIQELSNILGFYWNSSFAQVFGNTQFSEWRPKLALLARARDPLAHSNLEYLTPIEIETANIYCRGILSATKDRF